jgi:ankyrin repeat protein
LKDFIHGFFNPHSHNTFMSWVQAINADDSSQWYFYPHHATPLYYSASFGLTEMVRGLIEIGVNLNSPGSRFGGTALHAAVIRHHTDVVKLLLEAGADSNQGDNNRATPLHTAAGHGKEDLVGLLLEYGADKEAMDEIGETAYDWAVWAGHVGCQHLLLGVVMETEEIAKAAHKQKSNVWLDWERSSPNFGLWALSVRDRMGRDTSHVE